jgi:molybdopterin-guanine dinucleotide biosynthesis protein A
MEAALRDASHEWLLFLPVDLPLLPHTMLHAWASAHLHQADPALRICYLEADGRPQPLVCLLHRTLLSHIQDALRRKEYKVASTFHQIAETLAPSLSARPEQVLQKAVLDDEARLSVERSGICEWIPWSPTSQDAARRSLWFSNLNTLEEFAHAESGMQELLI